MPATIPAQMFAESASVEPYAGRDGQGRAIYGSASTVRCLIEHGNRLVRNAQGEQVVSSARLYCPAGTSVPADSRVTIDGAARTVMQSQPWSAGGLPLPECTVLVLA